MADTPDLDATGGRQEAELALLAAMYPGSLDWNGQRRELTYRTEEGGVLTLRLPDDYPEKSTPQLVTATGKNKTDLRDLARSRMVALENHPDEETLDAIIQAFDELVKQRAQTSQETGHPVDQLNGKNTSKPAFKTVVVWLHHLLNTNKRKLALNPSINSGAVKGITKPGYPGVLVYSGNADAVEAHVAELRNQRWQAFQVRLDEPGQSPWNFAADSILEVESMSEVTKNIVGEINKQAFLKAIGVK